MGRRNITTEGALTLISTLVAVAGCGSAPSSSNQSVVSNPTAPSAIVGKWSCANGSQYTYLEDGSGLITAPATPNADSVFKRSASQTHVHYQVSENEYSIHVDYIEVTVAPADYDQIPDVVSSRTLELVGKHTLRMDGSDNVIVNQFAIEGDTLTEHEIRMLSHGNEVDLPDSAKAIKICKRKD
jgi:hypothetical protein